MRGSNRRDVLAAGLAAPALLLVGARSSADAPGYPFSLGIASGEPWPDSVVLWTRLAPEPLRGDGGMPARPVPVRWELADDARFTRIVRRGTAIAQPDMGHSVHVEPGGLMPGRTYWYRFIAGGEVSPVGRTRTAPARGARVDRARFCFASCQNYEVGYYDAYRHMVAEEPDLILFLGDYIYEAAPGEGKLRLHLNPEPKDVPGYRVRYANYKLDPLLQGAHAIAPWATTWDDHEVANDYADDLDELNTDPATFLRRRAAAYQVYWEHMPLRAAAHPHGPAMRLHRTLDWGALAQFQIIDDRQFRSHRACQPPGLLPAHKKYQVLVEHCAEIDDPARTMLGPAQERWLDEALTTTQARWNLLTQQTLMSTLHRVDPAYPERGPNVFSGDTWSTYTPARDRILRRWVAAKTPNPLALGGDIHSFAAADFHDPARPDGPPIASEFVGGSITSLFHDPTLKQEAVVSGIRYAENEVRGYGRVDLTADRCEITFRGLADATKPVTTVSNLAHFAIEAGRPGMQAG